LHLCFSPDYRDIDTEESDPFEGKAQDEVLNTVGKLDQDEFSPFKSEPSQE
jgi:hypothetical protein